MRQTFPYLYNQINSLRAHRKAESRAAKRSSASSQTQTQSGSESYEELYVPNGRAYAPLNIYAEPRARSYPLPDGYIPRAQGFQYYDVGFQSRPLGFPPRQEGFQYGQREFRSSSFVREESCERRDDIQRSSSSPSSQERYESSQSNSRERPNLSDPPLCLVSTHKSVSSFLSYNNNVIITKYTTVAYHVISSKLFGYYMYTFSQLLIAPPQTLLLQ